MPASRIPKTVTVPAVGWSKPAATLSSVVLPHPVGPTTETNSPPPTRSVVSRTAVYRSNVSSRESNVHSMCSSARAGDMIGEVYRAGLTVFRIRPFHELVRVGELEFDFLCLHLGIEGRYDFERVSRAGIRDDSVRRDGFLHLVEREQVQRLVGEQIRLGNRAEHVLGRSGLDPPVGADDGVGERLDRARVLSNDIDRCIEATRGYRTAQDLLGSSQGSGIGDDPDVPILLEFCNYRIGIGNRVDLTALDGSNGCRAEAHAYDGNIGGLEASGGNEVIEDHVRARARRGNADLQAFQVFRRLIVLRSGRGDSDCDLWRPALLHEALEILALGLHVERVLVGSRYDIGASVHHRPQRLRASGKVADRQAQTFFLEVAELLGDGERQVVQRGFSPDGDMQDRKST